MPDDFLFCLPSQPCFPVLLPVRVAQHYIMCGACEPKAIKHSCRALANGALTSKWCCMVSYHLLRASCVSFALSTMMTPVGSFIAGPHCFQLLSNGRGSVCLSDPISCVSLFLYILIPSHAIIRNLYMFDRPI